MIINKTNHWGNFFEKGKRTNDETAKQSNRKLHLKNTESYLKYEGFFFAKCKSYSEGLL